MLPKRLTKPISDGTIRGNKLTQKLKQKLSPAKRRHYLHQLKQSRIRFKTACKRLMDWQPARGTLHAEHWRYEMRYGCKFRYQTLTSEDSEKRETTQQ